MSSCLLNSTVKIIKGSDHALRVEMKNADGTAFDLTDVTSLKAAFPLQNGNWGTIEDDDIEVITPDELGAVRVTLAAAFTATLKSGERQGFEVSATVGGKVFKVQFQEILDVVISRT